MEYAKYGENIMEWVASEGMQGVAAFCSLNFSNILRMIGFWKDEIIYCRILPRIISTEKILIYLQVW